nr:unnamed protein product [Callosobruchus analis]
MIISKDLFLLGDQDYLRLPNKEEKRPPPTMIARHQPSTVKQSSIEGFQIRNSEIREEVNFPNRLCRHVDGRWLCSVEKVRINTDGDSTWRFPYT